MQKNFFYLFCYLLLERNYITGIGRLAALMALLASAPLGPSTSLQGSNPQPAFVASARYGEKL